MYVMCKCVCNMYNCNSVYSETKNIIHIDVLILNYVIMHYYIIILQGELWTIMVGNISP